MPTQTKFIRTNVEDELAIKDWEKTWLSLKDPEPIDVDELSQLLLQVERRFTLREGYQVKVEGSCFKGPQGVNYTTVMFGDFESEAGMKMMEQILKAITV